MDRFRYQVTPYRPINNLIPGQSLRKPFSSDLTKEEVMKCMKCGPVFRLFPGQSPIRVTGSNLDELHRNTFEKTSENGKPIIATVTIEKLPVQEKPVVEEPKTEPSTESVSEEIDEVKEEEVVEEVNNDIVEETVEEVIPEEEVVSETVEEVTENEVITEESSEEVVEEEAEVEEEEIAIPLATPNSNENNNQRVYQYNNYHGKKKRHHN